MMSGRIDLVVGQFPRHADVAEQRIRIQQLLDVGVELRYGKGCTRMSAFGAVLRHLFGLGSRFFGSYLLLFGFRLDLAAHEAAEHTIVNATVSGSS